MRTSSGVGGLGEKAGSGVLGPRLGGSTPTAAGSFGASDEVGIDSGRVGTGLGSVGTGSGRVGTGSGRVGTGSGRVGTGSGRVGTGSGKECTGVGRVGTGVGSSGAAFSCPLISLAATALVLSTTELSVTILFSTGSPESVSPGSGDSRDGSGDFPSSLGDSYKTADCIMFTERSSFRLISFEVTVCVFLSRTSPSPYLKHLLDIKHCSHYIIQGQIILTGTLLESGFPWLPSRSDCPD